MQENTLEQLNFSTFQEEFVPDEGDWNAETLEQKGILFSMSGGFLLSLGVTLIFEVIDKNSSNSSYCWEAAKICFTGALLCLNASEHCRDKAKLSRNLNIEL